MRILAIETSGTAGSLAALEDGNVLAEFMLDSAVRSAQSLAPGLSEALSRVGWKPRQVDLMAVAIGPGSFTGLRVGVTTAKTFAYAVGGECLGIDTLEAIAEQPSIVADRLISPAIDAQRGDVYSALYQRPAAGGLGCLQPPAVVAAADWLATLTDGRLATGPALEMLAARLPPAACIAPRALWLPTAATVGRLAYGKYLAGQRDDIWRLAPLYLRKSAAEEKAAAKAVTQDPQSLD